MCRAPSLHRFGLRGDTIEWGNPDTGDGVIRKLYSDAKDAVLTDTPQELPSSVLSELWEKYKHRFPSIPTDFDFYERISRAKITRINVHGCEIEVRQCGLGLPWFIDEANRIKLMGCFEPGSIEAASMLDNSIHHRIPFLEDSTRWLALPGALASYLPNVRVVEHRSDIDGYEYVTVLHDSERNYTWTYEKSTRQRASSFDGKGALELYELTASGIRPIRAECVSKYKPFVPVDFFNVPQNVTHFFPRKPLDTGVFRLPKLDDVLNIKMRNMDRDHALESSKSKAPFGYLQTYQNFWKTVSTREHQSGAIVRYRRLGKGDLVVSDICLGTMTFGNTVDEACAARLLDFAFDEFGVNFIDTSELYPLPASEDSHGVDFATWTFREIEDGAGYEDRKSQPTFIVATPQSRIFSACELSKSHIIRAVDGCLSRLKTDYIDLLQLHWPDRYVPMHESGDFSDVLFDAERAESSDSVPMEEQVDAIRTLISQGKIRHWGLSNETPWGVLRFTQLAKEAGIEGPVSVQLNYNLLCRNDVEKGFVELCRPHNTGIGILAYGPLAGGVLTGKYLEYVDTTTSGRLLRYPSYMKRYRGSLAARAVKEYYDIAMSYKYPNLCALAMRWVLTRPFICSTIIGVNDMYQLRENLHCLNPCLGVTDLMEREINQLHWKWRDPLRICQ
ncbi:aldo-keto reductase, putative [Babesia bigemina]|uniref:Aldo-keto reductase, putative n=1 Tax=Babesia bigemina TaxID=5866 RepID=A0A061DB51_BABBI|nr:aldo-keto reductase, putative [Babesia bigemina]CDR97906.1 aldo-keto reductase, putative [Babesia bigemina]|eukprot:XP_012770092.1 aldo-keto reductase, putative [Babesia bigemina]